MKPRLRATRRRFDVFIRRHRDAIAFVTIVFFFIFGLTSLSTVSLPPDLDLGFSLEKVLPLEYWIGLAMIVVTIFSLIVLTDSKSNITTLLFLTSCVLLIIYIRSVLSLIADLPYPLDSWSRMSPLKSWLQTGRIDFSSRGYVDAEYAKNWPLSYVLAYAFVRLGVPLYTFFKFAPLVVFAIDVFLIYGLVKEVFGNRLGLISSFLFSLLNTASSFPLHWCAQLVGSLLYLFSVYVIIKVYKHRPHLVLPLSLPLSLILILTHHVSTLYFIFTILGMWLAAKAIRSSRMARIGVIRDTVREKLPLVPLFPSVSTVLLWLGYGFLVYPTAQMDALEKLIATVLYGLRIYETGNLYYFISGTLLGKLVLLTYPVLIIGLATTSIIRTIRLKGSLHEHQLSMLGWTASMSFIFTIGMVMTGGTFFEPARVRELICVSLYPFAAEAISTLAKSKKDPRELIVSALFVILLIAVAVSSVLKVYAGASIWGIFTEPPPWW